MQADTLNHLSALATLGATIAAVVSTAVSYVVLRSATDPDVIVYAEQHPVEPRFLCIVIHNLGKGVARDIRFRLSDTLSHEIVWRPKELKEGAFASGIPTLPPGGRRVFIWGDYREVIKHLDGKNITCEVTFRGSHFFLPLRTRFTNRCVLEAESFRNSLDRRPDDNSGNMVRALETVAGSLKPLPAFVRSLQDVERHLNDIKRMR